MDVEGTHFNTVKVINDKPTVIITPNEERLEELPLRSGTKDINFHH